MSLKITELLADKRVVLASASPRRHQLLRLLTDNFEIMPSDCDESFSAETDVFEIAEILAGRKCEEVAARCEWSENTVIIGCDTLVISPDKMPMGKPQSDSEALEMLRTLNGRESWAVSGVCIYYHRRLHSFTEKTAVKFFQNTDAQLVDYVKTGEPHGKAGAYAVQGFGGLLIESICGDYNNIVGLPVSRLSRKLAEIIGDEK